MPVVWTESQTLTLVTLYSRHECLRNPFHRDYRNKFCRYKAYKEIVESINICGITVCDCIKRITQIKALYCYELTKIGAAISCEKFYEPKTSWFPIMHQLLFPHVKVYEEGCVWNTFKGSSKGCSCYYTNCRCAEAHKSRKENPQLEDQKFCGSCGHTDVPTKDYWPRKMIDFGSNTRNVIADHEMQTECPVVKDASTAVQSDSKHTCEGTDTLVDIDRKMKGHDEFDMFGKSIASQLRNINFEVAIKLEQRIQDLIAQERLDGMKSKCVSHTIRSECASSCSDCKVITRDKMICSCGLPVIMINADSSCEFDCK